jgi:hypothetical protein
MDLTSLLSTGKGKLALGLGAALLLIVACLACGWGGYRHGRSTATAEGEAKLAKLESAQAQANRLASDTARKIVDAEVIRRDQLEAKLATARKNIAAQSGAITDGRIADASRSVAPAADGACRFSSSWVRLYNEAAGFGDGDSAGSAAAPGADGTGGGVPAAQGRELPEDLTPSGVTEADVLITHRDNMRVCRDIKARYLTLREWAQGLPQTANATEVR